MPVGVVSAMEEEIALYRDTCTIVGGTERAGLTVHQAQYEGHTLVLVRAGVGKVNAAMATQLLIDEFNVGAVLCTGSAGALHDEFCIGDVVVAEECIQHDLRVDFLDIPPGQIPFTDLRIFEAAPALVEEAHTVDHPDGAIYRGRVLTGDTFVQNETVRRSLHEEFGGDCVDMEGAAVGQVCRLNSIPFLVVRAISDRADGRSDVDFQAFLPKAARTSAHIVLHLLTTRPSDSW